MHTKYNTKGSPYVNSISSMDLMHFIQDGRRAFNLKRSINSCPDFEVEAYRNAWCAGYCMMRDGLIGIEYDRAWIKSLDIGISRRNDCQH